MLGLTIVKTRVLSEWLQDSVNNGQAHCHFYPTIFISKPEVHYLICLSKMKTLNFLPMPPSKHFEAGTRPLGAIALKTTLSMEVITMRLQHFGENKKQPIPPNNLYNYLLISFEHVYCFITQKLESAILG